MAKNNQSSDSKNPQSSPKKEPLNVTKPPASSIAVDPTLRTIGNRWTPRLAADGWTPISNLFLKNYPRLGIRPVEALFIVHLMSFKWNNKAPFPRYTLLAENMGVTPTAVRSYARSLERKGLLVRRARIGSSSRFLLQPLFDKLHTLLDSRHSSSTIAPNDTKVAPAVPKQLGKIKFFPASGTATTRKT